MDATTEKKQTPGASLTRVPPQSDEELLLRYRQTGDRELFSQLVHRYERELFSYLKRYLRDAEMAEDVFQSTFLQVHLKCGHFEEGRKIRPWLYTIATNQAIDAQRRNKRHRMISLDRVGSDENDDAGKLINLLESSELDPLDKVSESERRDWVRSSVDGLPDSMRAAVQLVYYQGLKYREAAEILAIPVGTVKSRLHAAVLRLNEVWENTHKKQ